MNRPLLLSDCLLDVDQTTSVPGCVNFFFFFFKPLLKLQHNPFDINFTHELSEGVTSEQEMNNVDITLTGRVWV